jgi:hypothetical protein
LLIIITPHVIRTGRDLEDFYEGKLRAIQLTEQESGIARERPIKLPTKRLRVEPEGLIRDEGIRK